MSEHCDTHSPGTSAQQVPAQDARYFAGLAAGVFEIPCCNECGRWHFYPRVCCPYCHSEDLQWRQLCGLGTVYSTTTVRRPEGGDYCVCLVDLDEGPRLMSTVVSIASAQVRIGQRVQARIQAGPDGALLVFAPVKAAS